MRKRKQKHWQVHNSDNFTVFGFWDIKHQEVPENHRVYNVQNRLFNQL